MNKEKLMQYISKAIDRGDQIDIFHFCHNETKEDAETLAIQFNEIMNENVVVVEHEGTKWYEVKSGKIRGTFHYSKREYMVEDVDLFGEENAI